MNLTDLPISELLQILQTLSLNMYFHIHLETHYQYGYAIEFDCKTLQCNQTNLLQLHFGLQTLFALDVQSLESEQSFLQQHYSGNVLNSSYSESDYAPSENLDNHRLYIGFLDRYELSTVLFQVMPCGYQQCFNHNICLQLAHNLQNLSIDN